MSVVTAKAIILVPEGPDVCRNLIFVFPDFSRKTVPQHFNLITLFLQNEVIR